MAGRHKNFNEEEALKSAMDVFWSKGYEATSLEDLLDAMELNKGSLYNTFGSKRELFLRSLDFFAWNIQKTLNDQFLEAKNPVMVIKNFFLHMCDETNASDFKKGCLLSNVVTEMSLVHTNLESRASTKLQEIELLFCTQLTIAQANDQLKQAINPKVLSRQLINFWSGIHVTMRIYNGPNDLKEIIDDFFDMATS